MHGSAEPNSTFPTNNEQNIPLAEPQATPSMMNLPPTTESGALPANDLEAALQLLVERARYITGATGAALALLQDGEMVCRASAGSCAPSVGARLQVLSGLTGESIARKQLLRCDNAENDPRVNLDTCRALGIASIVVLPLVTRPGQVRGLFELFSDHAYAFEERDLIALERMAELTRTALDLSERREVPVVVTPKAVETQPMAPTPTSTPPSPTPEAQPSGKPSATPEVAALPGNPEITAPSTDLLTSPPIIPETIASPEPPTIAASAPENTASTEPAISAAPVEIAPEPAPAPSVPEAMLRVQKCSSCGFPVSEGRTLCIDCENKQHSQPQQLSEAVPAEFVPAFLASQKPPSDSWLANHVNLLAVLVLILSIVVAIVVFR